MMKDSITRLLDREYDLRPMGCLMLALVAVGILILFFFGRSSPPINERSILGLYAKHSRDEEKIYIGPGGRYTHYFEKDGVARCVDGGEWWLSSDKDEINLTNWHDSPCYGVNGPKGAYSATYFEGFWGKISMVMDPDDPGESFVQVE